MHDQIARPNDNHDDKRSSEEQSSETPEEARLESQSCNTTVESSEHEGPFTYWPNQVQRRTVHLNQFSLLFHSNRTADAEEIFTEPTEPRYHHEHMSHGSYPSIEQGEDYTVQTYYVMQDIPNQENVGPYVYGPNPFAHQATASWQPFNPTNRRPKKQMLP